MKYLIIMFLLHPNHALACNQKLYDGIYKVITREAIVASLKATTAEQDRAVSKHRYDYIASLRALCNGQLSSYERERGKR